MLDTATPNSKPLKLLNKVLVLTAHVVSRKPMMSRKLRLRQQASKAYRNRACSNSSNILVSTSSIRATHTEVILNTVQATSNPMATRSTLVLVVSSLILLNSLSWAVKAMVAVYLDLLAIKAASNICSKVMACSNSSSLNRATRLAATSDLLRTRTAALLTSSL